VKCLNSIAHKLLYFILLKVSHFLNLLGCKLLAAVINDNINHLITFWHNRRFDCQADNIILDSVVRVSILTPSNSCLPEYILYHSYKNSTTAGFTYKSHPSQKVLHIQKSYLFPTGLPLSTTFKSAASQEWQADLK
jgi:hypothetical protein